MLETVLPNPLANENGGDKVVHGHEDAGTEVPRKKLVSALQKHTDFTSTESFDDSGICRVVRL